MLTIINGLFFTFFFFDMQKIFIFDLNCNRFPPIFRMMEAKVTYIAYKEWKLRRIFLK